MDGDALQRRMEGGRRAKVERKIGRWRKEKDKPLTPPDAKWTPR